MDRIVREKRVRDVALHAAHRKRTGQRAPAPVLDRVAERVAIDDLEPLAAIYRRMLERLLVD